MGASWKGVCAAVVVIGCHAYAWAGLLETHSNPVANGAIIIASGHRVDWTGIPAYAPESGSDAAAIDFIQVQMAHDDNNLYVRFLLADQTGNPQFYGFMHNLLLDTDSDRGTGYVGGGSFLPIGADYLIQGPSAFGFAGGVNQEAFSWSYLAGLSYDDFPTSDIEVAIPRTTIGDPAALNFVVNAATTPEDYYPDGGNAGESGDYFRYVIPEPGAWLVLILGITWSGRRRR